MGSGASRGPKPILYSCPMSPSCRAVLLTAKAIGRELDIRHVDLLKGEHMTQDFLKINPDHTVPTLDDKGFKLWESRAVMTYLVDTYSPGHAVYPKDSQKRATINRLLYTEMNLVSDSVSAYTKPQIRERKSADPAKAAQVEKALDYIERILEEGKFLAGTAEPTLVDFSVVTSMTMLELLSWDFGRWPEVGKWMSKMKELPYYAEINPMEEFKKAAQQMLQS